MATTVQAKSGQWAEPDPPSGSPMGAGTHALGPLLLLSHVHELGAGSEVKHPGFALLLTWEASITGSGLSWCSITPVPPITFLLEKNSFIFDKTFRKWDFMYRNVRIQIVPFLFGGTSRGLQEAQWCTVFTDPPLVLFLLSPDYNLDPQMESGLGQSEGLGGRTGLNPEPLTYLYSAFLHSISKV